MKTIREWLEELPEPYRTQAINNTEKNRLLTHDVSLREAITVAFFWGNSPEGHEYWAEFYKTLNN